MHDKYIIFLPNRYARVDVSCMCSKTKFGIVANFVDRGIVVKL